MSPNPLQVQSQVDFDIHQILHVRLIDPSPADVNAIARQIGLPPREPADQADGSPDITIRFVDQLERSGTLRYLNVDEMAYNQDSFLILKGKHKAQVRVKIDFDQIGSPCEITCEHGAAAIPLLIPVMNFTALAKGALPLHAAAFEYCGQGVLATGWAKGGKTTLLLAFMARGANYIGDEWVYLSPDRQQMYGIPEPIGLSDWQLQQLPEYQARLSRRERNRIRSVKLFLRLTGGLSGGSFGSGMKKARALLKRQLETHVAPQRLFDLEGKSFSNRLDKVFLVDRHDAPNIAVTPLDPLIAAERMLFSLQQEQMSFYSSYLAYRFAFPDRSNPWISRSIDLQRQRLGKFLSGRAIYSLTHPYPVQLSALFNAVQPYILDETGR